MLLAPAAGRTPDAPPPAVGDIARSAPSTWKASVRPAHSARTRGGRGAAPLVLLPGRPARLLGGCVQGPVLRDGAVGHRHDLVAPPLDAARARGAGPPAGPPSSEAKALGGKTGLERGYIGALDAYYAPPRAGADGESAVVPRADRGAGAPRPREDVRGRHGRALRRTPCDSEVAAFYALALLGAAALGPDAPEPGPGHGDPRGPVAEAEGPPGVPHYLIHGYDYPPLAERDWPPPGPTTDHPPWIPHVLHMPSHIFTRLGIGTK